MSVNPGQDQKNALRLPADMVNSYTTSWDVTVIPVDNFGVDGPSVELFFTLIIALR